MANNNLGQLIKQFRENRGMTQSEFADVLEVKKGKLAHWEEGTTIPRSSMLGRIAGTLMLTDSEYALLLNAAEDAKREKVQEEAAIQEMINAQVAEEQRLKHKKTAATLFWSGVGGFLIGCVFTILVGQGEDFRWYYPLAIGFAVAGIPFGWNLITDKHEEEMYRQPYSIYPDERKMMSLMDLFFFVIKFIFAYLIGLAVFPFALVFHAYKGAENGSSFQKIMRVILICISAIYFLLAMFIGMAIISESKDV